METVFAPFNNQIDIGITPITFPKKESRHGKHKPGYIRPEFRTPEGRKKWNERSLVGMRKLRAYRKSLKPKLTFDTLPDLKKNNTQRYWKKLGRPWNTFAYSKGKKGCVVPGWNKKWEKKPIADIIKANKNALLILTNKKYNYPVLNNAFLVEIDIDIRGYTALFPKCSYNSNRIGSVKYLAWVLKKDCKTKNQKQNQKLVNCKFDFKVNGHSYFAGSTHENGNFYDLKRSFGAFDINKPYNNDKPFATATELYQFVIHTIKQFEMRKEMRRMAREQMKLEQQIIIPPK